MLTLEHLFENNRRWARDVEAAQAGFFAQLARQQAPQYLWIGCSDSRVPANEIVGLLPGELFVHRNIANMVVDGECNCMSVIQYSVEMLKVRHIIVCGHYGCGGVAAAMAGDSGGMVGKWLEPLRALCQRHRPELEIIRDDAQRMRRCCEINVAQQVGNVCACSPVQEAWRRGQDLWVHGWIYDIADGLLRDLDLCVGREQGEAF